jgi:hypothetical protein
LVDLEDLRFVPFAGIVLDLRRTLRDIFEYVFCVCGEVFWWGIDLVELAVSPRESEGEILDVSEKWFHVKILRSSVD